MFINKRLLFLVFFTGLLVSSCGAKKILSSGDASDRLSSKNIIKNHYSNSLEYNTIRGRMKVDFDDGSKSQSFTLSLRMERDKAIWVSATLSLVKALITPNRVTFYNKLDNTYFDGSFNYLSNIVGTELDFEKVQNVLLGQALLDLTDQPYKARVENNVYELEPEKQLKLFEILFAIEPSQFKMSSQRISQPEDNRLLVIDYSEYQNVEGRIFPNTIAVRAKEDIKETRIDIEYKNITFDEELKFPYKIPEGYEKIVLE